MGQQASLAHDVAQCAAAGALSAVAARQLCARRAEDAKDEQSPRSVTTRCPSTPSGSPGLPETSPQLDPANVARCLKDFAKLGSQAWDSDDLERAVTLCGLWGLNLGGLPKAFATAILQVLLASLRLFHCIDLPAGDLEYILAHAAEYGLLLGLAARSACAVTERRDFCVGLAGLLFLSQTHLCDEPCFVPTWLEYVLDPLRHTFRAEPFGLGQAGAVKLADLDRVVIELFAGLSFRLHVPPPRVQALRDRLVLGAARQELELPREVAEPEPEDAPLTDVFGCRLDAVPERVESGAGHAWL